MKTIISVFVALLVSFFSAGANASVLEVDLNKEYKDISVHMKVYIAGASEEYQKLFLNKAVVRAYKTVGTKDMNLLEDTIVTEFSNSCVMAKIIKCTPVFIFADTK